MRFGLDVPTTGEYADARTLAQLATEAEVMGWDGFFIWDVLLSGAEPPLSSVDPWIALTAIALRTARLRLGLFVLPLPRHRPWLVARQLANLDQLSGGRVTCAVGSGHQARDFSAFGEADDPATRGRKLDEGLAVLNGLWQRDHFSFSGDHYTLDDVTLASKPLQQPRIPLWVAGGWPLRAPFRRAARWDGACLKSRHQERGEPLAPADLRACATYLQAQRQAQGTTASPFDLVMSGETPNDPDQAGACVRLIAEAGATWWVEEGLGWTLAEFRERIRSGPPRV
jgi:alkanesulfonate monooxygenase SsuD/methylene tetrahydromethanopterin reductase-like flavin-dependent oxidoreductase (luciferase family)